MQTKRVTSGANFIGSFIFFAISVFLTPQSLFAANFLSISPTVGTILPTYLYLGDIIPAYYTVINQGDDAVSDYLLQSLPVSITQSTASDRCPNPIALPKGASCILELDIRGPVVNYFPTLCKGLECFSSLVPLNVSISLIPLPMISAGFYDVPDFSILFHTSDIYPLIANSTDGGSSWAYTLQANTSAAFPPDFNDLGSLASSSCSGLNCIAAGNYFNESNDLDETNDFPEIADFNDNPSMTILPFLVYSRNGGRTWENPINSNTPALPENFSLGQFVSTSCSGLNCIAAGSYLYNQDTVYPLLASSINGGQDWTYSIDRDKPALPFLLENTSFSLGQFLSTSCSGIYCVAAGSYSSNGINYPLLASGINNGQNNTQNWTYVITSNTPSLPSDFNNGRFVSTSCSGLYCVAVGTYSNGTQNFPLIATSQQGGQEGSWSYILHDAIQNTLLSFINIQLVSVSCSNLVCAATGFYNTQTTQYPLLVISRDGGVTWTYSIKADTPAVIALAAAKAQFSSVSCSGLNCVAAGWYDSITINGNDNNNAINTISDININDINVDTSNDNNSVNTSTTNASSTIDTGSITNLNNGSNSVSTINALNDFNNNDGITDLNGINENIVTYPLLANSRDGGLTWSFKITASTPNVIDLSGIFQGGQFLSCSCSNLNCIATGLYRTEIEDQSHIYPLLANSQDGGLTWTYKISATTPNLPENFDDGQFSSASVSNFDP